MAEAKSNIYSKALFKKAYGSRTIDFYSVLLSQVILYGKPGLILDLGSGLGFFTQLANDWGMDIIGLEGSFYAVNETYVRTKGLNMMVHDLYDPLPFKDASASNIVLNQVVEHIDHKRYYNLLQECWRVLQHDGILFVYSPSRRNIVGKTEPTHVNLMLPSELKRDLELSGFTVIHQPDSGLWFMPSSGTMFKIISKILLRLMPNDWISATTNAIAKK